MRENFHAPTGLAADASPSQIMQTLETRTALFIQFWK